MAKNHAEDYLENSVLRFNIGSAEVKAISFKKQETGNDFFGRVHAKNYYELHYITGGNGFLIVDDEKYMLKKGVLYVTGPGLVYHCISKSGSLGEYALVMQIEDTYKSSELVRILSSRPFFSCNTAAECEVCFKSAEREIKEYRQFYIDSIINNFKQIVIFLIRQYSKDESRRSLPEAAKDDKYCLITDIEFIFNLRGLTLKRLSDALGLSERQCQRFLMDNYGMSYSEKLLQSRMIKAADYLAFTDKDIQSIVEEVGYSESSYFTRIFKRNFGMTPREYRKKYRDKF